MEHNSISIFCPAFPAWTNFIVSQALPIWSPTALIWSYPVLQHHRHRHRHQHQQQLHHHQYQHHHHHQPRTTQAAVAFTPVLEPLQKWSVATMCLSQQTKEPKQLIWTPVRSNWPISLITLGQLAMCWFGKECTTTAAASGPLTKSRASTDFHKLTFIYLLSSFVQASNFSHQSRRLLPLKAASRPTSLSCWSVKRKVDFCLSWKYNK